MGGNAGRAGSGSSSTSDSGSGAASGAGSGSASGAASGSESGAASGGTSGGGSPGGGSSGTDLGTPSGADAGNSEASAPSGSSSGSEAGSSGEGGPPQNGVDSGMADHTGVWRIMPLGDSITGSMCPPQILSAQLKTSGRSNFLFVGSNLNNQSCFGAPNVQTEGHGGYLVTDLVGTGQHAAELPRWCAADKADVVLMQFGTNDAWNSRSTQSILDAYSVVLADLRAVNPGVILFVAQITPLNPAGCANCEANVEALNAQIPAWATAHGTAASPIYVVDVHSVFTASAYIPNSMYTGDGVHPNPAGSRLIAAKWYDALVAQGLP